MNLKKIATTLLLLSFLAWSSYHLSCFTVADLQARAGKASLNNGDYETAQTFLASSIQYAGSVPNYHHVYADSLYAQASKAKTTKTRLDFLQQAKKAYQKATELNSLEGEYWLRLAKTCWWLSRFNGYESEADEVESFFLRALATDPNNGLYLHAIAKYYISTAQPDRAFDYFSRLAMVYPDSYRHLLKHPRWSDVIRDPFEEGLQAATSNMLVEREARSALASIAASEKDWAQAAVYTEKVIQDSSSEISPSRYVDLGHYYLELQTHKKAKKAFIQALKISEDRNQMLQQLFSRYFRRPETLDFYVELCQETAVFDATVRNSLPLIIGRAHYHIGDFDAATRHLRRSLQERETAEAHRYLAEIAMKKKDWDTAELASQRATELEPKNAHYNLLYVRCLQAQKKYVQALEAIRRAIQYAQPPRHDFYNIQAQLYWKLGDYQAAIESWDSAHEIAPRNAHYPRQIAHGYKMLQDFSAAERYYLAALKLKPEDKGLRRELDEVRRLKSQ